VTDIPRKLSMIKGNKYYRPDYARFGVRVNGIATNCCMEYDMDNGWAKLFTRDGRGNPIRERGYIRTVTVRGEVEAFLR
jgi:hypothetical protein